MSHFYTYVLYFFSVDISSTQAKKWIRWPSCPTNLYRCVGSFQYNKMLGNISDCVKEMYFTASLVLTRLNLICICNFI